MLIVSFLCTKINLYTSFYGFKDTVASKSLKIILRYQYIYSSGFPETKEVLQKDKH